MRVQKWDEVVRWGEATQMKMQGGGKKKEYG